MKNKLHFFGIIALAAIIGFTMVSCDTGGDPTISSTYTYDCRSILMTPEYFRSVFNKTAPGTDEFYNLNLTKVALDKSLDELDPALYTVWSSSTGVLFATADNYVDWFLSLYVTDQDPVDEFRRILDRRYFGIAAVEVNSSPRTIAVTIIYKE